MLVGTALLLAQVAMIVRARFDEDRYFCWAPHDSQNQYEITAVLGGRTLDAKAIFARYHLPAIGVDPRTIEHVKDAIRARESQASRPAAVDVRYRTNGHPMRSWKWPER